MPQSAVFLIGLLENTKWASLPINAEEKSLFVAASAAYIHSANDNFYYLLKETFLFAILLMNAGAAGVATKIQTKNKKQKTIRLSIIFTQLPSFTLEAHL